MVAEKLTRERRRQRTREALVEAAAEVFVQRGFNGASLDQIAETAGFTRGAIYKHFDGKVDLFLAVIDRVNERALEAFAEQIQSSPDAAFDPVLLAKTWKKAIASDDEFYTIDLEFALLAQRNPDVHKAAAKHRRRNREAFTEFTEEAAKSLGFRLKLPAEVVTGIMSAAFEGFTRAAQAGDRDAAKLLEKFLELVLPTLVDRPEVSPKGTRRRRSARR